MDEFPIPSKALSLDPMRASLDAIKSSVGKSSRWLEPVIEEIEATGWAAEIYDKDWKLLWVSPELRFLLGVEDEEELGLGEHIFSLHQKPLWSESVTQESRERLIRTAIPYIAHDCQDDLDSLKALLPEDGQRVLEATTPRQAPPLWSLHLDFIQEEMEPVRVEAINSRLHDDKGNFIGTARVYGPGIRASILSFIARGDERMFERMTRLVSPRRQRVGILFADLEGSVALSRTLPSSLYFQLISEMTSVIDEVIINHDGVVGKHVGDGVSAFFLVDDHGDISAAVRAAIVAGREIRDKAEEVGHRVAREAGVEPIECKINVGLHFGATVYMGQIVTGGRLEVTALGDEVNECARLETIACGGEVLASKGLVERLNDVDAEALKIDLGSMRYQTVSDVAGEEKRTTDISLLPVCQL
jgi:class 3 adenylate cyclase